jgi:hypothetical protein
VTDGRWWLLSDAGLAARIAIGGSLLAIWAVVDLLRRGRAATRWREYTFLLVAAIAAAVYGATNDLVTSSISWEYFYYGKGLMDQLGPHVPPAPGALAWGAAKVGMASSWSAGILAGAVLLLVNRHRRPGGAPAPPMSMPGLGRSLAGVALGALIGGAAGGILGRLGLLDWLSADFRDVRQLDILRPARFMTTWGIHAGSYLGAAVATVWCAWRIRTQAADRL